MSNAIVSVDEDGKDLTPSTDLTSLSKLTNS